MSHGPAWFWQKIWAKWESSLTAAWLKWDPPVVFFPVFIKDYHQPSLVMYEIESVPIPIPDKNTKVNSYSQIKIYKPYIVVGEDYYIQLCMTELIMWKDSWSMYH